MKKASIPALVMAALWFTLIICTPGLAGDMPKPAAQHPIVHIELPSTDLAKSKAFYEALFGWKVQIDTVMNYASFETGGELGGGFMKWDKITKDKEATCAYVLVDNAEEMGQKATALGGCVVVPKTAVGDMGWFVTICDPNGAAIGLWESTKKAEGEHQL
jgi:predicted enzyme related to lactoylglutathione lyase